MTKVEILKELLKNNLEVLNKDTYIDRLRINFEGDNEFIVYQDDKLVLVDKLSNYDVTFDSQKKFISNIANELTSFFEFLEDLDDSYFEDLIRVNNDYYFNVLGQGDIYKNNYIKIDFDYLDFNDDERNEYIENFVDEIIDNLDEDKIRVVLHSDINKAGFYVDGVIHEDKICVGFIDDKRLEDIKNIKEVDELDNLVSYDNITLYYSLTTGKEIKEAIEFIKELIKRG